MTETPQQIPNERKRYVAAELKKSLAALGIEKSALGESVNYVQAMGLKALSVCFESANETFKKHWFEQIPTNILRGLLRDFPVNTAALNWLIGRQIYLVNETMLEVVISGDFQAFEQAESFMKAGQFEPENQLHRGLCFTRYYEEDNRRTYKTFGALPTKGEIILTPNQEAEIEAMSEDNLKILAWLKAEALKGPCTVIFNKRYGTNYVGDILKPWLKSIKDLTVAEEYVSSRDYDVKKQPAWDNVRGVSRETCEAFVGFAASHLIMVDGSSCSEIYHEGGAMPRMPRSMRPFQLLAEENGWNIEVMIPGEKSPDKVMIGLSVYAEDLFSVIDLAKTQTGQRRLTLLSATTGESNGLFDDPEDVAEKEIWCFGPQGLEKSKMAPSEKALVKHVQKKVKAHMRSALKQ